MSSTSKIHLLRYSCKRSWRGITEHLEFTLNTELQDELQKLKDKYDADIMLLESQLAEARNLLTRWHNMAKEW